MSDVVERAKAALEGVTEGPWGNYGNAPFEVFQEPEVGQEYIAPRVYELADAQFISRARSLVPELVAEIERLHTWNGLMSLVDEHYPTDIFPHFAGVPDNPDRDPGPRILSLLREVERLRSYKSLPPGMVWQDYYSPEDVCKIRAEYETEIERLKAREDTVAEASYRTGQLDAEADR